MKKIYFLVLAFFISGCAANVQTSSTQQGPKESVGALSGMVIGGALANDMAGDSRNKSLATVLGAFVGGVMNLAFMAIMTFFMMLEKIPDYGKYISKPLSLILIGSGTVLVWF